MMRSLFMLMMGILPMLASAQQALDLKQQNLERWKIGTANFSGITALGANLYGVVSDKEPADGFYVFSIEQNAIDGQIEQVKMDGFYGNPSPRLNADGISARDCEGIAYFPPANTVFIAGEGDQQILEYTMKGNLTGRELAVPEIFGSQRILPNFGFEALSYCPATHKFWTVTESTLPQDGPAAGPQHPTAQNILRFQSFGDDLMPQGQFAYRMDTGKKEDFGKTYVFGIPAVAALPDGKLLVLEREADVSHGYMSSEVICKVFLVDPTQSWTIDSSTDITKLDPNKFMVKTLVSIFSTKYTPFKHTFANYEGMCLGRKLSDGRQTVLLVSDSQAGYGKGPFHLNDYIKVLVLP